MGFHEHTSDSPILSLIIASRNDQYMGNSIWRLETALNYTAINIHKLDRESDIEIVVSDWGSETPLHSSLNLSDEAAQIVSFVSIPPKLAQELQGDSPFPEVLALNAAARRSKGEFIGRIDNDTLVGINFLKQFFDLIEEKDHLDIPLDQALIFTNRRQIPYRFAVQCPPLWEVDWYIQKYGDRLLVQSGVTFGKPFYYGPVGIWLIHRKLWIECSGYDERLLYWGWMEPDMIHRLMQRYQLIDWDQVYGCDFYHLEHYNPRVQRKTNRSGNVEIENNSFRPNHDNWGLNLYPLERTPYSRKEISKIESFESPPENARKAFQTTLFRAKIQENIDIPFVFFRRIKEAVKTIQDQPFTKWPSLVLRWFRILFR